MWAYRALPAVLVLSVLTSGMTPLRGDEPVADRVSGSVADGDLAKKAPVAGVIISKKSWDALLKDWDVKKPFTVDFDTQLVVVATSQGSSLNLTTKLSDSGDLTTTVIATADLQPGFRYALKRVERKGIKTVNGKPLPKD